MGKKKERQKGKNGEKMVLSICIFLHLFGFFDLFFCFYFACILLFDWKKEK